MIFNSSVDFEASSQPKYRNNKKNSTYVDAMYLDAIEYYTN